MLAFDADAPGDVPDGGMGKQDGFDEVLQEIDHVIVAADVGQLVGEDGFDLARCHAGCEGDRQ